LGCTRDEHCGALERCESSRCVARGCLDDRECILALGLREAVCRDEECVVACRTDSECAARGRGLSTCQAGACRDLGCERNSDCQGSASPRALLLCLPAEEAAELRGYTAPGSEF
jgi:hypothetical protein